MTDTALTEALRAVPDPWLLHSALDLGIIRSVDGSLIAVALPDAKWPPQAELVERIREAAVGAGVVNPDIRVALMTDTERAALVDKLPGRYEDSPIPFMSPSSRTRVLGMSSGKGGVGKSSSTVNLAIALQRRGHRVGVLDADVYGFSVPKMLGSDDPAAIEGRDVVMMVPPVAHGLKVFSIGFFVEDDKPVLWRGPMLHKALEQFLTDVTWGELDFLLVDMPPGTGDVAMSMAQYLPRTEMYVITTPQAAAQRVAQRTAYAARNLNLPLRGVIENMSWFTGDDGRRYELFGAGGGQQLADDLGVPLLGQVPLVPALREGGDVGLPITVSDPEGEASRAYEAIAAKLDEMGPGRIYRPGLKVSG